MTWENFTYASIGFVIGGVVSILLWFLAYNRAWREVRN